MASEYKVAEHYTREGYAVYWTMMSQSRDDIVIRKGNEFTRVQVKTGTWVQSGKYKYLQCRLRSDRRNGGTYAPYTLEDCDVVVIVEGDRLWEIPVACVAERTNITLDTTNPTPKASQKDYNPDDWLVTNGR